MLPFNVKVKDPIKADEKIKEFFKSKNFIVNDDRTFKNDYFEGSYIINNDEIICNLTKSPGGYFDELAVSSARDFLKDV